MNFPGHTLPMDYTRMLSARGEKKPPVKPIPMPIPAEQIHDLGLTLDDRTRSLMYLLYLSGARISEGLQVQTHDFNIAQTPEGHTQVTLRVNTRKKRTGYPFRILPLRSASVTETDMLRHVLRHKATFERAGQTSMYPIRPRWAERRLSRVTFQTDQVHFEPLRLEEKQDQHLYPHFLRHCRATHLVQVYGFDAFKLQHFMGWSSITPATVYVQLDWRDASKLLLGLRQDAGGLPPAEGIGLGQIEPL